jgi:hypothetical protein
VTAECAGHWLSATKSRSVALLFGDGADVGFPLAGHRLVGSCSARLKGPGGFRRLTRWHELGSKSGSSVAGTWL